MIGQSLQPDDTSLPVATHALAVAGVEQVEVFAQGPVDLVVGRCHPGGNRGVAEGPAQRLQLGAVIVEAAVGDQAGGLVGQLGTHAAAGVDRRQGQDRIGHGASGQGGGGWRRRTPAGGGLAGGTCVGGRPACTMAAGGSRETGARHRPRCGRGTFPGFCCNARMGAEVYRGVTGNRQDTAIPPWSEAVGGGPEPVVGAACRRSGGSWKWPRPCGGGVPAGNRLVK